MTPKTSAGSLVIFGITGDLARQMTFRALYRLERGQQLDLQIIGVGRRELDDEKLRSNAREAVAEREDDFDEQVFMRLAARLSYVRGDIGDAHLYEQLSDRLGERRDTIFYLETPPTVFADVVDGLANAGLLSSDVKVLIEKPFGHDLRSARELAASLHRHLEEEQIYRIDHFLGKPGIQDLLRLRFANPLFEPVWNREHVECVQVTMAEQIDLDDRGSFYDGVGQLRDDVVNHLMQLIAAATMDAPAGEGSAGTLQGAVLAALRAVRDADPQHCVRGRYTDYPQTEGVDEESDTETYVALELWIDNPRWSGVPFLIRTGKALAATDTEVRLLFAQGQRPSFIPEHAEGPVEPAQVAVRLDPRAGVRVTLDAGRHKPHQMVLESELPDDGNDGSEAPYELLLWAAFRGERDSFVRQENAEECWRIFQPLLDSPAPLHDYERGSWGPSEAAKIAEPHGGWQEPWGIA